MYYIYDIPVNFQKEYIDFFEWDNNDKIINIIKAPLIKVDSNTFSDFLLNSIQILTESKNSKLSFKYYLIMTDDNVMAIKINKNGQIDLKSSLSVTDELDIIENRRGIKKTVLNYRILKKNTVSFQTRKEKEMFLFLEQEINKLSVPTDNHKIQYLYLECFGMEENNSTKALSIIKKNIHNCCQLSKIYQIFKLIEQK